MIEFKSGDILRDDAEALVNTVNCVGVMGRGIALQFKDAFPDNFKAYAEACRQGAVQPGRMFVFETGQLTPPRYIVNFPTKRHWRGKSRMIDIETGLGALVEVLREKHIRSVAIPPLGSGLGGLNWQEVKERTYFMQEAGEPLGLKFQQALCGPYAETLRHVVHAIEGHLLSGYADGGGLPDKQLQLVPRAVEDAAPFLVHHSETRARFDRVTALVEGIESPFGWSFCRPCIGS